MLLMDEKNSSVQQYIATFHADKQASKAAV
jgi:hypothetical protein